MIGQQISHFYVIRALGSGGMGVVYEAQDTRLPQSLSERLVRYKRNKPMIAMGLKIGA